MSRCSDMLVYLRKRAGLSQVELSTKLDISRSAISMYETGKREPNLETLEIFADFYNVDMNTLTGREELEPSPESDLDEKLVSLLTQLTPEETARVADFISGLLAARKDLN